MEHAFADELAYRDGPLHRLDARVKTAAALLFILTASLLPARPLWPLLACLAAVWSAVAVSRLPFSALLRRTAALLPFILTAVILVPFARRGDGVTAFVISTPLGGLQVYREGLTLARTILLKSLISAQCALLLISTTRFSLILTVLRRFHVPRTLCALMSFLYRYLFLLTGELRRLTRAAHSRNWGAGRMRWRAAGGIVGSLFLRSYARGERVYDAMLSRGFDGSFPQEELSRMRARDVVSLAACAAACALLLCSPLMAGVHP